MKLAGMKTALGAMVLAAGAMTCVSASAKTSKSLEKASTNWNSRIEMTADGSHRFGNPDAPVKLTEYVSYTCPHCAHYQQQSDPVLRLTVVPKGKVQVTVTNLLRNPVDLTVAMLANCGDPKRFFVRHNAFFATQDTWLQKAIDATKSQQQRWYQGPMIDRMRAMASDLELYKIMSGWGIDRAQTDACLADKAMLEKLSNQQAEIAKLGLKSTPSFTLNGKVLTDVHDWTGVSTAITSALADERDGTV